MNIPPIVHARVAPAAQGHARVAPAVRLERAEAGTVKLKRLRTFFQSGDVFIAERTLCSSS
jgi:hypothetical protein